MPLSYLSVVGFCWFSGIYNILLSVRFLFYIFPFSVNLSRICFEITTFLKFPSFTTVEPLRSGDEFQEIFQILSLLVLELLRVTIVEKTQTN